MCREISFVYIITSAFLSAFERANNVLSRQNVSVPLKYKTIFSLRFSSSLWQSFGVLVEADVVALIARPEHNLQARTTSRRFVAQEE